MARRRSRKTPVSAPNKIDVVVKKAIAAPVEAVVAELAPVSEAEYAWRDDVWAFRTTAGVGEACVVADVNPLVLDVWREDVAAGLTNASLGEWLKQK